jgi:hypothetical protein
VLTALLLSGCASGDAGASGTAERFAALEEGWNRITAGEHASCSHGSEYSFLFRPADPERVAIFFQGGGGCWMGETCALDRQPMYRPSLDDLTEPSEGIFDFENPENPISDWSVLFVPYCTGDVHVGNATVTYQVEANDSLPARSFQIRHTGLTNARTALDWLHEHVPDPREIFVTGVSAGSLGSAVFAHTIAERYPDARVAQLGDAAGGYRADRGVAASILDRWGTDDLFTEFEEVDPGTVTFESFYTPPTATADNLRMAQVNYHADEVQLLFLQVMGVRDVPLVQLLDANLKEIAATSPDFRSYLLPGTEHGIIRSDAFYRAEVDGVRLRDWTAAWIEGADVATVDCADCR